MHFSWSPDGREIVFDRFVDKDPSQFDWMTSDLYIVNADGSDERQLTSDGWSRDPSWSPDGSSIAFARGGPDDERISLIAPTGGDIEELTLQAHAGESNPYGNTVVWSPDSTLLAFSGHGMHDLCYMATVEVATGSVHRLIESPALRACPGQEGMSWAVASTGRAPESGATPIPTATESTEPGRDVGLAFNLCDVQVLKNVDFLGDGTDGTAWSGAPLSESGRCPIDRPNTYVVAVDLDGDGGADDAWEPLEYCFECQPYAAVDLDADGNDELVVLTSGGTTPRYDLFDVRTTDAGARLEPIRIIEPGDAEAGFPAGDIAGVNTGGDEGFRGYVACRNYPTAPEIVVGWADGPVDGPGSDVRQVHIATLVVEAGLARVVSSDYFERPTGETLPYPFGTDNRGCGVNWNLL
jgi:hypothetical protein